MKLARMLTVAALAAGLTYAQDNRMEAAIIPVKTLNGDAFDRLVKILGVFNQRFTADNKLRTIVIYAPKDATAEMRRVIETLDKPGSEAALGRNVDLTVTFLRASAKPVPDARPLPADMEAVAKQLRSATAYKDVQLWDSMPLRVQEGRKTEHTGRLPGAPTPSAHATVQMSLYPESVWTKDGARYVRFADLKFGFRLPYLVNPPNPQFQFLDLGINTAGDFKEGQKSVLGKVSGLDDDSAIFVVISPKVLD